MDFTQITLALITAAVTISAAALLHIREVRKNKQSHELELSKHRLEIRKIENELFKEKKSKKETDLKLGLFSRVMDLSNINPLIAAVDDVFQNTKADRFLILVAINGKDSFNVVSVIFEQHKDTRYRVNAIGTYRNINIDETYKDMLKHCENVGVVELDVDAMSPCLLKDFYEMEGVKHSKIRFIARKAIDADNDFIVFSSIATHVDSPFTQKGKVIIKTKYESTIIPCMQKVLD